MITAHTLLTAVIVTESAVSPRARWVSMLAIIPPGDAPSSTSPTASSGGKSNHPATAKASSGEITARLSIPITTPRGALRTRPKSAGTSVRPRLHMITAIAAGRSTEISNCSSTPPRSAAHRRFLRSFLAAFIRSLNSTPNCVPYSADIVRAFQAASTVAQVPAGTPWRAA